MEPKKCHCCAGPSDPPPRAASVFNSLGCSTRGGPPAWGLCCWITAPRAPHSITIKYLSRSCTPFRYWSHFINSDSEVVPDLLLDISWYYWRHILPQIREVFAFFNCHWHQLPRRLPTEVGSHDIVCAFRRWSHIYQRCQHKSWGKFKVPLLSYFPSYFKPGSASSGIQL